MREKLDITEAPADVWPICPHCQKELRVIWVKSKCMGIIDRRQFFLCPPLPRNLRRRQCEMVLTRPAHFSGERLRLRIEERGHQYSEIGIGLFDE